MTDPCPSKAWRRPTLPRLKTQYHRRGGFSRPSSGWDRVGPPRYDHQVARDVGAARWRVLSSGGLRGSLHPRIEARARACMREAQADRAIRTGQLHALPRVHTRPIDVVVFHGSQGRTRFEEGFPLRCFQRLSRPNLATRLCRWRDNRSTRGPSTPVLSN